MSASLLSNALLERPPVTQPKKDYVPDGDYIPKICIVGYGRHGKDEAASTLHGVGPFTFFGSTSWAALPEVAASLKIPQQIAWETRHLKRDHWKSYCDYLRRDDPCYLIRKVLAQGNICSGIRDKAEIEAAITENLFDAIFWVDRPGFPADPTVTFTKDLATDVITNDGTLEDFRRLVLDTMLVKGYLNSLDVSTALK